MKAMHVWPLLTVAVLGGCGGQFILSAPDQVGPTGGFAATVVRIQRTELAFLPLAVSDAALRMQIADSPMRASHSDKHGYAGAHVPAPTRAGTYALRIDHQNTDGEETSATVPAYVWDPNVRIVAVDISSLPESGKEVEDALAALRRIAAGGKILYLTQDRYVRSEKLHGNLEAMGYPDGPILPWRLGGLGAKEASPLSRLKETFPGLETGLCLSPDAAEAFTRARMKCIVVGKSPPSSPNASVRSSWAELAAKGL